MILAVTCVLPSALAAVLRADTMLVPLYRLLVWSGESRIEATADQTATRLFGRVGIAAGKNSGA